MLVPWLRSVASPPSPKTPSRSDDSSVLLPHERHVPMVPSVPPNQPDLKEPNDRVGEVVFFCIYAYIKNIYMYTYIIC